MSLDAQRLGRILEMLGSSHDGEVVAAARAAERLIKAAGITWTDLAQRLAEERRASEPRPAPEARPHTARTYQRKPTTPPKKKATAHRGVKGVELVAYLMHPSSQARITHWEKNFILSLKSQGERNGGSYSEDQWRVLWEIGVKVGAIIEPFAA